MKVKDIALFLPNGILASLLKIVKLNIDEAGKEEIVKNGLYHITSSDEVADKILESGYLRPATGFIKKNITSYGKACVFLFNGKPTVDNFLKNITNANLDMDPYLNPTMAVPAISLKPKSKEELKNYKSRGLVDDVLIYEGYCILPDDEVSKVKLVPDLVRDENNNPIKNIKTNKFEIEFREANQNELINDGKNYLAKDDYLKFVEEERKALGYKEGNRIIGNTINKINSEVQVCNVERKMTWERIKKLPEMMKNFFKRITTPKLDMSTDEKIHKNLEEFNFKDKNPYRDKKFGEAVAKFEKEGLSQLKLKDELEDLTTSDIGKYFRAKNNQLDKSLILSSGIHGINHNNRVAILSSIIAKKEGMLLEDNDNKVLDMLLSAAYYHDIGRRRGAFTFNVGPHAKNSSRKIDKIDLKYLDGTSYSSEDKSVLKAIVEAHEAKDKNMDKIIKKYNIPDEKIKVTKDLMNVLKDADALDRVRIDFNKIVMNTNLNPNYLRLNTSKQLLNMSYELEDLTKNVSFEKIISYKTEEQNQDNPMTKRELFVESLKQGVRNIPEKINKIKKTLRLNKSKDLSLKGKIDFNKLQSLEEKNNKDKDDIEIEL